jgi:hypothetical protein
MPTACARRSTSRPGEHGVVDLSPCEFLDRLADAVPPPRKHWHRYHGVFAPNHPLRRAVTALAIGNATARSGETGARAAASLPHTRGESWGGGAANADPRSHDTSRRERPRSSRGSPRTSRSRARPAAATSASSPSSLTPHRSAGSSRLSASRRRSRRPGARPTGWPEVVQAHDDRDAVQASPDDQPVIDIHSR